MSTSTPKPEAKKILSTPLQNPILLKVKEEPIDESMDTTDELWNEFENNELNEKSDVVEKKDVIDVKKPRQEMPEVLQKIIVPKKRTYKDCPDCLQFIKNYGNQFSKEVVNNRIAKCTRHHRTEEDLNETPEGFWDPFMLSLPPDDRRKEVFIDYRLVNQKK